jgi:HPt (histidine-containing phosphotransfer) domain-containing protein
MATELIEEFIFDARDHLTTAGTQLLELEKHPDSLDDLNALMGTLHTIKGNSGFVNLKNLYGMLHGAENLLQTVRDTPGHTCPSNIINQLFQVLDAIEAILSRLEGGEDEDVEWLPTLNQAISEAEASLTQPDAASSARVTFSVAEPEEGPPPAAPKVATAAALAPSLGDPVVAEDKILVLEDGQLAGQGSGYLDFLERGCGFLVLDVNGLTTLGLDEIKIIRDLVLLDDTRFMLVLDRDKQPDFWRLLVIWSLENKIRSFPNVDQARAAMKAASD